MEFAECEATRGWLRCCLCAAMLAFACLLNVCIPAVASASAVASLSSLARGDQVVFGGATTLRGSVKGVSAEQLSGATANLHAWEWPYDRESSVVPVAIDAHGSFAIRVQPDKNTRYRVSWALNSGLVLEASRQIWVAARHNIRRMTFSKDGGSHWSWAWQMSFSAAFRDRAENLVLNRASSGVAVWLRADRGKRWVRASRKELSVARDEKSLATSIGLSTLAAGQMSQRFTGGRHSQRACAAWHAWELPGALTNHDDGVGKPPSELVWRRQLKLNRTVARLMAMRSLSASQMKVMNPHC